MRIYVDSQHCIGCTLCVKVCMYGAIDMVDRKAVINDRCTLCKACVEVCRKYQAIVVEGEVAASSGGAGVGTGVWVVAEREPSGAFNPVTFELAGKGRELADALGEKLTVVVLEGGDSDLDPLEGLRIDEVLAIRDGSLAAFTEQGFGHCLAEAATAEKPRIVLCGGTSAGRSFLPRVAAALATGLTADCTGLSIDPETKNLVQTRPAFGGNLMASIICPERRPQMATVRPQVFPRPEKAAGAPPAVRVVRPSAPHGLPEVLEFIQAVDDGVPLGEASIIISGGRGVGGPAGFELLHRLAAVLGGAVGASRSAVDAEWIPYPHQVGQTGRTVSPKIYLALGISGAVQHLAGMQSSGTIIAINRDPDAPIFKVADLGIVGDLFEIIPPMIKALEARKG